MSALDRRLGLRAGVAIAGLWAWFVGVALATSPARHAPIDLALLVLAYGLLAAALHLGTLGLAGLARPLGLLGSLGIGALVVHHQREQTLALSQPSDVAAVSALVGCVYFLLFVGRPARPARLLGLSLAAALATGALLAAGFYGSNTLRWHLLRHHKLLGVPAYYAFAPPVGGVCDELWSEHASLPADRREPSSLPTPGATGERPNLVFVLLDTLRADALAAYGGDPALMPGLNALAERSLVFEDVIANATWTRPSVASFFTGLRPEQHGAIDRAYGLPEQRRTLAEVLRAAGYQTAAFVANYAAAGRDAGFDQGFDHFAELSGGGAPYARAEQVGRAVLDWLDAKPRGRPLFLYLHYLDPHTPYLSALERFRHLKGKAIYRPGVAEEAYREELRYLDAQLSRLLDALRERLPGPTILLVTSDHGEEFAEHAESGHGHSLYEEVAHLPVLLGWLDAPPARLSARLEARDFFDLLLELTARPGLDVGRWAARHDRQTRLASIYSSTGNSPLRPYRTRVCMRGYRQDGYFLIWSGYGPSYELYDLERDPHQTRNLAREAPEQVRAMSQAMEAESGAWTRLITVDHGEDTVKLLKDLGYIEE